MSTDDSGPVEDEGRLDRIESLTLVKHIVVAAGSAAVDIADKFSGASPRHDPGRQFVAAAVTDTTLMPG